MTPSRPDIDFPTPNLHGLDRLSRHVDLARANRLEELFVDLAESEDGLELAAPEPAVLAQGLFEHRQADILDLADGSLALFGLVAKRVRHPREPWTHEAFDLTFARDVADAWWRLETWREDVMARGQTPRRASFTDLDEFLRFLIPRLAVLPPWPVVSDSGREFVPHIIGQPSWDELRTRAAREGKDGGLGDAGGLVSDCCQRTLAVESSAGLFPGLPEAIDRDALAAAARAELEQALDRFVAPPEPCPF